MHGRKKNTFVKQVIQIWNMAYASMRERAWAQMPCAKTLEPKWLEPKWLQPLRGLLGPRGASRGPLGAS